jgi:acetylornithine deacetylase/succinyl-diaminopimelate desuccinylase-like protein
LGIPAVYFGSGSIDHAHRENELVTLEELNLMAKLYAYLILDVCGPHAGEQS